MYKWCLYFGEELCPEIEGSPVFNINVQTVFIFRIRAMYRNIVTIWIQYWCINGPYISDHISTKIKRPFVFNIHVQTVLIFRIILIFRIRATYRNKVTIWIQCWCINGLYISEKSSVPKCKDRWFISIEYKRNLVCLLYTSPSPRDLSTSRMPSSA